MLECIAGVMVLFCRHYPLMSLTLLFFPISFTDLLTVCLSELFNVFPCRHILAVVHFNFNLHRDVRHRNSDNAGQLKFTFPKFKNGEATVPDVRISQNFGESVVKINSTPSTFTILYLGKL